MATLTAAVLCFFGAYAWAMATGRLPLHYTMFLLLCTVASGAYCAADALVFAPRRRRAQIVGRPWWAAMPARVFPIVAAVLFLRAFVFEPYRIPSGSMLPTLHVGDMILVSKWEYGLRVPVLNDVLVPIRHPERGDVIVFHFPADPSQTFIKRAVGLPGDRIEYADHVLKINGSPVALRAQGSPAKEIGPNRVFTETLGAVDHQVVLQEGSGARAFQWRSHTAPEKCTYGNGAVTCTVPPGSYFVLGDNRDGSDDSRFWGFVPDRNIVGHALVVWMNFNELGRIGRLR